MHLKYRPKSLDEIVGLESIKKSLANFKFDSPVLFMGERGCGKSTLAGILATDFGALEQSIRTINCGYYTKINDMRDEIDLLQKTTLFGNKKALILEEVHALSKASYQAWLTPLENLSDRILVIACTTEPQEIPETLLERFRTYRVRPLDQKESRVLLESVIEKEGLEIPKWVKVKIIEQSKGIPRNILTALPKVIGITDENEVDMLLEIISIEQEAEALDILRQMLNRSTWKSIQNSITQALKEGNPKNIRTSLMALIGGRLMSKFATDMNELTKLTKFYDALQQADGYPEKANLIVAIYKAYNNFIH